MIKRSLLSAKFDPETSIILSYQFPLYHRRLSEGNQTILKKSTTLGCVKRLRSLYLARSIDYVVVAFFCCMTEVARTALPVP